MPLVRLPSRKSWIRPAGPPPVGDSPSVLSSPLEHVAGLRNGILLLA